MADTPDELHGWQARREAQIKELGTYVATEQIYTDNGALAYDVGHPVPVSNIHGDGRVILGRHICNPRQVTLCDEASYDPARQQCGRFNEPTHWSQTGAVGRRPGVTDDPAGIDKPDPKRSTKSARSAAEE